MMDPIMLDWAWLMGSFFIGVFLGCMTGLIPGFHVNNVALLALSMSPLAVNAGIPLSSVAAIIVSMGTVHTFLNYIPSALIGAPDGDTALALLPGHRMLISGHAAPLQKIVTPVRWTAFSRQFRCGCYQPNLASTV